MQLQTCGASSGAGHQSRLHPSGWSSWATAGTLLSPRGLSSSVAGPLHVVAQGSTRAGAEASRSPRACAGHWSRTTLSKQAPRPAQSQGQGKCPPSASSDKECGAHTPIFNLPVPFRGATRLTASQQKWWKPEANVTTSLKLDKENDKPRFYISKKHPPDSKVK